MRPTLAFAILLAAGLTGTACSEQVIVRDREATCGNGSIESGETCDDGNANDVVAKRYKDLSVAYLKTGVDEPWTGAIELKEK